MMMGRMINEILLILHFFVFFFAVLDFQSSS